MTACSQEDAVLENTIDKVQIYTLYLDAEMPFFDTGHDDATRASGNNWGNGDVIYVSYSNGGSTVVSSATYSITLGAFQFSSASLQNSSNASCSVYYFRGGNSSVSGSTVKMDKYTAIFADTNARYSCSNNVVTMSAAFKPQTWRLCFRGLVNSQLKVKSGSNIRYNTSLNLSTGTFTTQADSVTLLVQDDGFTPYVYGQFTGSSNTIRVKVGGTYYARTITSSKLAIGESGYFTVPTTGNHANWTTSRDNTSAEYVDLGLPSGILWAKCNLGGLSEEEYGDYYAWGETDGYNGLDRTFSWATYKWWSGTSLTKYNANDGLTTLQPSDDAATVFCGSPWRLPTQAEWLELNDNTTKTPETINGIKGRRLKSSKNGNSLFLPFGGYFDGSLYVNPGTNANYWSSTLSSNKDNAYMAYTPSTGAIRTNGAMNRSSALAIRAVYDPNYSGEESAQDINKGDYGSEKNLDGTTGGGVDNTGSNDINKGGYGSDKNLDNN